MVSRFKPAGDQPQAIKRLTENLKAGVKHQVLLGVTGSGKTFTMASVIEKIQKPVLIISHNKTLAAQLYQEFKEFFPNNAVHYFVSYYDYYQPEAYIPQTDTYIEKDAKINEEIDRLRHSATQDLLKRKDVIVVASVSCIYSIGSPEAYQKVSLELKSGQKIERAALLFHLTALQYQRNDVDFKPGVFRVRGNIVEVFIVTGKEILKIELAGGKIEKISISSALFSSDYKIQASYKLFPAHFWVTPEEKLSIATENIRLELEERLKYLKKERKPLEAQRLGQRTNYDLEILKETGYCHGVENYSRHLEFRKPGEPSFALLDYFSYPNHSEINKSYGKPHPSPPKDKNIDLSDYIVFIDESHMTLSQIQAMAVQDRARKNALINYGFRLPSAIDNRPLTFEEFNQKTPQTIYVSATPAKYEMEKSQKINIVEQLIRPTGLLEPSIEIRPIHPGALSGGKSNNSHNKEAKNQIQDLVEEIRKRVDKNQRVLVLTLTKRLAEAVSDYLTESGIKNRWIHAEIKTLERPQILKGLREGKYDVLVGINLLREGLDLPEVSLVAILDADKEGFLRNETTLVQTMGRAARHPEGRVIMYADKITFSMKNAIKEVQRRRKIQEDYNKKNRVKPKPIVKEIRDWSFGHSFAGEDVLSLMELKDVKELEKEMKKAAKDLNFEKAAEARDLIKKIKNDKEK